MGPQWRNGKYVLRGYILCSIRRGDAALPALLRKLFSSHGRFLVGDWAVSDALCFGTDGNFACPLTWRPRTNSPSPCSWLMRKPAATSAARRAMCEGLSPRRVSMQPSVGPTTASARERVRKTGHRTKGGAYESDGVVADLLLFAFLSTSL